MHTSFKNILLQMLEAIGFTGDRNAFVADFIRNTFLQAFSNLLAGVPPEKREEILKELQEADTPDKSNEVMAKYFTEEQRNNALQQSATDTISLWMKAISPQLKDEHKHKLKEIADQQTPQGS